MKRKQNRKKLPVNNIHITRRFILQFGSYFIVGLIATIVEWAAFYLFANIMHINTYLSVAIAFIFSTFVNWLAGRLMTFRGAEHKGIVKELSSIYAASLVGLGLNELIMWIILSFIFLAATPKQNMLAKMIATAIVFFWNFFIRKLVIYKDTK